MAIKSALCFTSWIFFCTRVWCYRTALVASPDFVPLVSIKACLHNATSIIGFFCAIMLKPQTWFMSQWIWKELCTSQRTGFANIGPTFIKFIDWALNKFSIKKSCSEFSVLILLLYSKRVTILRGFLLMIWLTANRLCKERGRLVLQMQGLSFLGKINFRFLLKRGS